MKIDKNFFPGWVRKSITFTIDDGDLKLDKIFLDTVKPYGILGTFNIPTLKLKEHSADEYREMYRGYGISNHCKYHPLAFEDGVEYDISDDKFDPASADTSKLYKAGEPGVYKKFRENNQRWSTIADTDAYIALASANLQELYEVFGEANVHGYCWPYCIQKNENVVREVRAMHEWVRGSGYSKDESYGMPKERADWHYTANYKNLTEEAKKYEAFEDDGELKFFCFGVHSFDFDRNGCWNILEDFVKKYGNRPENYYYADIHTIFTYEDAVNGIIEDEEGIYNPSDVTVYIKADGKRVTVPAKSKILFKNV
ncbi:MAG: hypothetical protein IJY18_04830 [Clostridia bacterium]|nr:hypothetical protein [Clostridia bacterium]